MVCETVEHTMRCSWTGVRRSFSRTLVLPSLLYIDPGLFSSVRYSLPTDYFLSSKFRYSEISLQRSRHDLSGGSALPGLRG